MRLHNALVPAAMAAAILPAVFTVPALALSAPRQAGIVAPAVAGDQQPLTPPRDGGSGTGRRSLSGSVAGPRGGGANPAPAAPARVQPACGEVESTDFPLGARIRGGPTVYRSGGGYQSWYLDLTNNTAQDCEAIHPVVVFTDRDHQLNAAQFRMDFLDGTTGRRLPVSFEQTDRDETIAIFDGRGARGEHVPASRRGRRRGTEFEGFRVPAAGSLTITVRLAFTADTPPGEILADAALVQRRGDDGSWAGESGGYRFSVEEPTSPEQPGSVEVLAQSGVSRLHVQERATRLRAFAVAAVGLTGLGGLMVASSRWVRRSGAQTRH
ncbi:hypothetical protein [Streptomyces sp. NPDC006879]|uniref:hypothetical protein n=1 Tax=Streptomyces sp. NPDC006879 TaxID=3364767 RepID=UPI00369B8E64